MVHGVAVYDFKFSIFREERKFRYTGHEVCAFERAIQDCCDALHPTGDRDDDQATSKVYSGYVLLYTDDWTVPANTDPIMTGEWFPLDL